jgi:cytochrome c553
MMNPKKTFKSLNLYPLLILVLILAACGGDADDGASSEDAIVSGDAGRGEALYKQTSIGSASAPGCITCHSLEDGVALVGPSHAGIGVRAANVVAGQEADDYLEESIVDPAAHVSEGFNAGVMYANYGRDLSDQGVADLVAFLLSLK